MIIHYCKHLMPNLNALINRQLVFYPLKTRWYIIPSTPLGHKGKSFQGESFYTAENPAIGATIYIHVRDDYSSLQSQRTEREKTSINDFYPSKDSIRMEQNEQESFLWVMIKDAQRQCG